MLRSTANGIAAICLCSIFLGCKNPMSRSTSTASTAMSDEQSESPIRQVSSRDNKPVTFTDSPPLQYGTGKMDANVPDTFDMTNSGLRYRVLRKSRGRKPKVSNTVTVNYRGWLDNGKEFDSSYDRGEPTSFPLAGVVAGWTEGMQLIGEGGMIELWVPPGLGYGQQGSPPAVPPNATLHFVVELLNVQ